MSYERRDVWIVKEREDGSILKVFGIERDAEDFVKGKPDLVLDQWPVEFKKRTIPKILDTVWMVVCPPDNAGVIYALSQSAPSVWEDIEKREVMGTGMTAAMLRKKGYRAKQVHIVLPEGS